MKKNLFILCVSAIAATSLFCSCNPSVEVTEIALRDTEKRLVLGEVATLSVNMVYDGEVEPPVTWTTSNTNVAVVNNGNIQALSKGSVVITAAAGDKSASCSVSVTDSIGGTFEYGNLVYYGDFYQMGIANNFQLLLYGNAGDTLVIEFNTDTLATDNLPSGTYTAVSISNNGGFEKFTPKTLVAVFNSGYFFGTHYKNASFITAIVSGRAVVARRDDDYLIEYDFTDHYGNKIAGKYIGSL